MGRWVLLAGSLVLALASAACAPAEPTPASGDPGDEVVLSDNLARRVDGVCDEATRALDNVSWPSDDELSLATAAPAIAASARVHRGLIDALSALPESETDQQAIDELTSAGAGIVAALEELELASERGDDAAFDRALDQVATRARDAQAAGNRVGSTACYTVADG